MRVILKEKIVNLGKIGDQVTVKRGYGRNYLIPREKAVVATPENIAKFEKVRSDLEKAELANLEKARERVKALAGLELVTVEALASEDGKLFGSVGPREIAQAVAAKGYEVAKSEIHLPEGPIRRLGEYLVDIKLHSEVLLKLKVEVVGAKAE